MEYKELKTFCDEKIKQYPQYLDKYKKEIALANKCKVIQYNTNDQIDDNKYLEIKNNCWKKAKTDWVLVCDVDELLNITYSDLVREDAKGTT